MSTVRSALSRVAVLLAVQCAAAASGHPGIHEQQEAADRALVEKPADPSNHITRGKLYKDIGDWDAALDSFQRARALGASEERVATLEGETYFAAGWVRTASRRFDAALASAPDDPHARIGRARARMKLGDPEGADADYAVAYHVLERVSPGLVLERRDALVAAGRPDDAVALIDEQIARVGLVPALQEGAIELELARGRHDDALRRVDALLAQSPDHPLWSKRRADVLKQAGRAEEAQAAYRKALDIVRARSARRNSRRLADLEKELVAALATDAAAPSEAGEE